MSPDITGNNPVFFGKICYLGMPAARIIAGSMYEDKRASITGDLIVDVDTIDFHIWHNPLFPVFGAIQPDYMLSEEYGTFVAERTMLIIPLIPPRSFSPKISLEGSKKFYQIPLAE